MNRKEVNPFYFEFAERHERAVAPVADRLAGFTETVSAYPEAEAAAEAERCMSCGLCVECDNCFVFCPDMAVQKKIADAATEAPAAGAGVGTEAVAARSGAAGSAAVTDERAGSASDPSGAPPGSGPFYFVLDQYCKGCGLCVTECPRGAVRLEQVTR